MPISNWIEKLGRAMFEAPFGAIDVSRETPELAEIRLALLDEVKSRSHRVAGREVFPYNLVRIRLRGLPPEQAQLFNAQYFGQFCQQELRSGLSAAHYRFPDDLEVEVETTPELPAAGEDWLTVTTETRAKPPEAARRATRVVVLKGAANERELPLNKARTNIGRTLDVFRSDGPSRRNDLAFSESDEISRTVSREHAHITFSKKTGEYRLFNDRSYKQGEKNGCGLWIIRDGLSHEVHRGPRGVRLEPGDEIHLGRAVLRFESRPVPARERRT